MYGPPGTGKTLFAKVRGSPSLSGACLGPGCYGQGAEGGPCLLYREEKLLAQPTPAFPSSCRRTPPSTSVISLETGAALRHGLCHYDGRGRGPHGAGWRDRGAQGLRLGQHQPARVSGTSRRPRACSQPGSWWPLPVWEGRGQGLLAASPVALVPGWSSSTLGDIHPMQLPSSQGSQEPLGAGGCLFRGRVLAAFSWCWHSARPVPG